MDDRGPRRATGAEEPRTVLRRLRLKPGQNFIVRVLSHSYKGCLTHWVKGNGEYCPGPEDCRWHAVPTIWKGYVVCESWDQAATLWIPHVLEITECLEQDFRGVYRRGQVWNLTYKTKKQTGGAAALIGELWEQLDPYTLPEPYDMRPVLALTYHRQDVRLTLDNPMPKRLTVTASKGRPPIRPQEKFEGEPVQEGQYARLRESLSSAFAVPDEEKNGRAKQPQ